MGDVIGLDELTKQLNTLKITGEESGRMTLEMAELIAEAARELVAVDTGELQESIQVVPFDDEAQVEAGTNHAFPQEFGTSKMPAHPYMRPAIEQVKDAIANVAINAMNEKIGEVT